MSSAGAIRDSLLTTVLLMKEDMANPRLQIGEARSSRIGKCVHHPTVGEERNST